MEPSKLELQFFLDHYFNVANSAMMTMNQLLYLMMRPERHTQEYETKYNVSVKEMMKARGITLTDRSITTWFNSDLENRIFSSILLMPRFQPLEFYFTRDENNVKIVYSRIEGMIVNISDDFATLSERDYNHLVIDRRNNTAYKAHDLNRIVIILARVLAGVIPQVFNTITYKVDITKYPFLYNSINSLTNKITSPNTTNIIADVLIPFCMTYRMDISKLYNDYCQELSDTDDDINQSNSEFCTVCQNYITDDEIRLNTCGHVFHHKCFGHMIHETCPNCRCTL